jgi:heavy metal sensor kinase
MRSSLRVRITAWYLALFSALFIGFGLFLYHVLAVGLEKRLDEGLISQADTAAALFEDEFSELHDVTLAARETTSEVKNPGGLIAVLQGNRVISASTTDVPPDLANAGNVRIAVLRDAHAATHPVKLPQGEYTVMSYARLDSIAESLLLVRRVLFFALPAVLIIAAVGGYLLASRSLAPLGEMSRQAHQISSSNLDARLQIGEAANELTVLAASFNELLGRLDQSFESMRRFVADASHELRTPLAVIRGEADLILTGKRTAEEYREALAIIQDESRRLSVLVEDLLNLARADAGHVTLRAQDFYFNDLVADRCRRVQSAAAARGVNLECKTANDLPFRGDEELLGRLVLNLVDNAIRYTPRGGKVTATAEPAAGGVRLRVSDTGIGISDEAAPHVFDRFYRADPARSRADGGFGLGLSIVKWIAESHNGSVALASEPAVGTTFTVTLPG